MSGAWTTILALAFATAAIRAGGPLLLGGRALPAPGLRVIALLAPALLAALVLTQTLGAPAGGGFELDARIVGVGAAAAALTAGLTTLPVVAIAAIAAALARLLG